jgi:hypothetical protein
MWFARGAREWARLFRENGVSLFVHNACHNAWQMGATFSICLGLGAKIEIVESFPPRAKVWRSPDILAAAQAQVVVTRNPGQIFDIASADPNGALSRGGAAEAQWCRAPVRLPPSPRPPLTIRRANTLCAAREICYP